jgi:site-specific recombinase XerD
MFDTKLSSQLHTWQHHLANALSSPQLSQPFTDAVLPFLAFLQEQGVTAPAGITPDLVTTWRNALQHGDVPHSGGLWPSEQFFAVRFFLRYLERYGDLQTDPARDLAPLPVKTQETAHELSAREAQALLLAPDLATDSLSALTYAVGWRDRAALDLLYYTGITPRRLLRLSDVDQEDQLFDPHGCVAAWLRARPRFANDKSPDRLFLNTDGTALDAAGLSALVANAARQAGIPKRISPPAVMSAGAERQAAIRQRGNVVL